MNDQFRKARILARIAKKNLWRAYSNDSNIVGAGFGQRIANGRPTGEPAVVVFVMRKVSKRFLPASVLMPRRIYVGGDFLEVDVVETGPIYPLAFTARERPAPSGISIGHPAVTAGTLGCVVLDNYDGSTYILSNNHVLANSNNATFGDAIIQQGTADGGVSPTDNIGTLKRFITLNPTGNTVDAAIAQITNLSDVVNQMKLNLMPIPSPNHRAVGLLFAGSCNRTIMNPIRDVMKQLVIHFENGGNTGVDYTIGVDEIGMNVEKVGRTTGYTTSTIKEIDVTVTVSGYSFGSAEFNDQFTTGWMSEGGDSGSIVCEGGAGGDEDHCDGGGICDGTSAASKLLGIDVGIDAAVEKEFRQRYLSQTKVGRYAIDVYFRNEDQIVERMRQVKLNESDKALADSLYSKYIEDARRTLLSPYKSDEKLTAKHLEEAKRVLARATPYMSRDEAEAARRLIGLASQALGKKPREILEMLNNQALYEEVVKIVSGVKGLKQPEPSSGGGKVDPNDSGNSDSKCD